jgi:hypothetical protein
MLLLQFYIIGGINPVNIEVIDAQNLTISELKYPNGTIVTIPTVIGIKTPTHIFNG